MIGAETPTAAAEIERKFLVRDTGVVAGLAGTPLVQGYFGGLEGWTLRLRTAGERAWLTLKSAQTGMTRQEIESPVPFELAGRLLAVLPPDQIISKIRYRLPVEGSGLAWEIDRFLERHHGLWLAEIELPRADYPVALPAWLGPEVTGDPRYHNAALAASPGGAAPQPAPPELLAMARRLLDGATRDDGLHAGAD
ncbi:MAG: CYTH domain-containing protein [Ferrovibrio sp.]|uniref:CYTH domain-containing protein n=1 Tax=Ferrovibrio sp. TaxID=1917215 RepID=UPI00391D05EB